LTLPAAKEEEEWHRKRIVAHISHFTEKLDTLNIIPDCTYRHFLSVNLFTFVLEKLQNTVDA
jgi:hypothetical protein